jgi:3-hydroxymyristoyl/3-hydroxydecanoyl-(acyl carrier protein) dehydratase/1-acyl-sn-glycerol-3-phosphate acyltransferase
MLCMIDRVTGYWPTGGPAGLGSARAEKDVDASEWFFKAHFFQDPVQPGSLGIEAMIRLLQWLMIERGMGEGLAQPRFEPLLTGAPMSWKYRGQVIPTNKVISSTIELTEVGVDARGPFARCNASLWVDGKRIYEASDLGMRIVEGAPAPGPWREAAPVVHTLDPATDTWIGAHCPTWTVPSLPMMSLLDLVAHAAGGPIRLLREARVRRWVTVTGPLRLRAEQAGVVPGGHRLRLIDEDRGDTVLDAIVERREQLCHPAPWAKVQGRVAEDPYASGALFHGAAFQLLTELIVGEGDSHGHFEGTLDLGRSGVPAGLLLPAALDAGTHLLPHDALHRFTRAAGEGEVAYPAVVERLELFSPTPTAGQLRVVARLLEAPKGRARFALQWSQNGVVWAEMTLLEALFPKGPLGSAPPAQRRAFLRDRQGNGLALSTSAIASCGRRETQLSRQALQGTDWLPGTVAHLYGSDDLLTVAQKEHMAAELLRDGRGPHPGLLPEAAPLAAWSLDSSVEGAVATVRGGPPALNLGRVRDFWGRHFNRPAWPVEDLFYGLMEKLIGQVIFEDPAGMAALRGRSALFLANHQTGIESLLFSVLASALIEVPTVTVAKAEHRHTWLGDLIRRSFAFPGVTDPEVITYFDREDKASLLGLIGGLAQEMRSPGRAVMVHVEGTRSLDCTQPVEKMSGAFIDMALSVGAPIVPVRFVGGLGRAPLAARTEFPVGMGAQDIWFGAPIQPEALAALHYGARKQRVIDGINRLGPHHDHEQPSAPDPAFAARVAAWQAETGCREEDAVLFCVLEDRAAPSALTAALLRAAEDDNGVLHINPDDAEQAWLGGLAAELYGPRGPKVRARSPR